MTITVKPDKTVVVTVNRGAPGAAGPPGPPSVVSLAKWDRIRIPVTGNEGYIPLTEDEISAPLPEGWSLFNEFGLPMLILPEGVYMVTATAVVDGGIVEGLDADLVLVASVIESMTEEAGSYITSWPLPLGVGLGGNVTSLAGQSVCNKAPLYPGVIEGAGALYMGYSITPPITDIVGVSFALEVIRIGDAPPPSSSPPTPPVLTSMSITEFRTGIPEHVEVIGTGFTSRGTVQFTSERDGEILYGYQPEATLTNTFAEFELQVDTVGDATLHAARSGPNGLEATPLPFTVIAADPAVVTALTPDTATVGSPVPVSIIGENFGHDLKITVDGTPDYGQVYGFERVSDTEVVMDTPPDVAGVYQIGIEVHEGWHTNTLPYTVVV